MQALSCRDLLAFPQEGSSLASSARATAGHGHPLGEHQRLMLEDRETDTLTWDTSGL